MDARTLIRRVHKPLVWASALTPAALLLGRFFADDLGPNPIETITNWTGYTTLVLLTVTLAITPLRRLTGWNPLIQLRRLIGLFAFFYVCLHFATYVVLDLFFDFSIVVEDIIERPYITVGFTAFVLLIPLAATSTRKMIRRLGRRWQQLHRLIYIVVPLGVLHFYWKVKADTREPLVFAAIVALLLLFRLPWVTRALARRSAPRRLPRRATEATPAA
jgi:sulfoxide reductase heme-binding subunit YedZ